MKCNECNAARDGECKAGVVPYILRNGEIGCSCNTRQVEKYMREKQKEWLNKSCVTEEAIEAVRDYMASNIHETGSFGYSWKRKDGKTVKLIVTIQEGERCQ